MNTYLTLTIIVIVPGEYGHSRNTQEAASPAFGTDPIAAAIVVVIGHFSHQRIKCQSTSFWVHRDNLQSEQNKKSPLIVLLCAVQ